MNAVELIERKRDGGRLTDEEISWLIAAYTDGTVTDYQMSAMAMAFAQAGASDLIAGVSPAEEEEADGINEAGDESEAHRQVLFTGGVALQLKTPLLKLVITVWSPSSLGPRAAQAVTGAVSPRRSSSTASAARKTASQRNSTGIGSPAT